MKPKATLILYQQREKKEGKYPVKVRVTYLRKHRDLRTGLDLTLEEFNEASVLNPKKKYQEIKCKLDAINTKVKEVLDNINVFTFQKFEDGFFGKVKDASDIFPLFDEYIDNLKKDGQLKTAASYNTLMNSLKRFKAHIGFYDIDLNFLKGYHRWLVTTSITENKSGASESTIGIYMRTLRSLYNYAIAKGIIKKTDDYPFGKRKYVIPAGRNVKKALSLAEVGLIFNYKAVEYSPEDQARDFWIFSYLCSGINFKDISLLKRKDIDGKMLRFVRAKTKRSTQSAQTTISCPLTKEVKTIISKWQSDKRTKDSYLFPIIDEKDNLEVQQKKIDQFIKTTNKYIGRIGEALNLDKKVTTYFSRHSYATVMKKGGVAIEHISEALGHSSIKTTKSYLDSFDDDSKFELASKLVNF